MSVPEFHHCITTCLIHTVLIAVTMSKIKYNCTLQMSRIEIEIRVFDKIEAGSTESAQRPLGVHKPNPVGNHWHTL